MGHKRFVRRLEEKKGMEILKGFEFQIQRFAADSAAQVTLNATLISSASATKKYL